MYQKMARMYDYFMEDVPYEKWVEFVRHFTTQTNEKSLLDLGCGTGEISFRLAGDFKNVLGIDLSVDMIQQAKQKNPTVHNIQFEQGDLVHLHQPVTYDVIISFLDVLNYLRSPDEVKQAFGRIRKHLSPNGVFLFDVHSLDHMDRLIEDELYAQITDEMSYVWFCQPGEVRGEVIYDLTFFMATEEERYERFDELHTQRTYSVNDYLHWLEQAGFSQVSVYADFDYTKENKYGDRLFFVCR